MYDESVQARFTRIAAHLDEKTKRLKCANEALALVRYGITAVSKAFVSFPHHDYSGHTGTRLRTRARRRENTLIWGVCSKNCG